MREDLLPRCSFWEVWVLSHPDSLHFPALGRPVPRCLSLCVPLMLLCRSLSGALAAYPIPNSPGYSSHFSRGHAPKAGKLGEGRVSPNQARRLVITELLFRLQETLELQNC